MQLVGLDEPGAYVERLERDPGEVEALFHDLLIGVTQFFRDEGPFRQLEKKIIPALFAGKEADEKVRVWVPGCASGEEVYSVAILLAEARSRLKEAPSFQVFGTDLDGKALDFARKGAYPGTIASDVPPGRLEQYFRRRGAVYEVREEIRSRCIFSAHNLLHDPPFSRLDLISCRNLLIYLEADVQKSVLATFHYALNAGGYLFLGTAENFAGRGDLFQPVDRRSRIFQRRGEAPAHRERSSPAAGKGANRAAAAPSPASGSTGEGWTRAVERFILEEIAPPGAVINRRGEVLYFSGQTGGFLLPQTGVPNNRLTALVRRELRPELRTAIHRAVTTAREVRREGLRLRRGRRFDLIVRPVPKMGGDSDHFIVVFREAGASGSGKPGSRRAAAEAESPLVEHLESELRATKDELQTAIEELETSNEELKSANEELVSTNEDLQSYNEELQTSREELQATNERLMKQNEELDAAIGDRQKLAAIVENSEDAIVSKSLDSVIQTWNGGAERLFGYTAAEAVGQSIALIIPPDRFEQEETAIMSRVRQGDRIVHFETLRRRKDGSLIDISLSISPIRDAEGRIIGAAKIARDISDRKRAERALKEAQDALLRDNRDLEARISERTRELTEINSQLEAFVYAIAHDLRAPLRSMQAFSRLLVEEYGAVIDEQGRDYTARIARGAERMDRLVLDLLDYGRVARSRLELEPVDTAGAWSAAADQNAQLIEERNARVEAVPPLPIVQANPAILVQCLANLINNAVKFVPPGTRPRIVFRAEARGRIHRLWIEDNGIGIAPEYRERIFRMFERLNPGDYGGTGIGLSIVRKAMERMGGAAGVESTPGEGSRFWVELPGA